MIIHADCIDVVPTLGNFDFIFADPPFNIGQEYSGYDDRREDFEEFTIDWVGACWGALGNTGLIALHGPDNLAETYLRVARAIHMPRIAWVNWHYRFGQCGRTNWIDSRCHCLIFAKGESHTWNADSVLVESDRVKYGDKRVNDTDRGGMRLPGTVWGVPSDGSHWGRVQGNNRERRPGHPNQLPMKYLERLILAYTNAGDRVLDPFAGAGTTARVCENLGRKWVTVDISKANCDSVRARLDSPSP